MDNGGHQAPSGNGAAARRSAANAGSAMLTAEWMRLTQTCYASIHPIDGAGRILFRVVRPSVRACVHACSGGAVLRPACHRLLVCVIYLFTTKVVQYYTVKHRKSKTINHMDSHFCKQCPHCSAERYLQSVACVVAVCYVFLRWQRS